MTEPKDRTDKQEESIVLLPCPFCGEQAVEDDEEVGTQTKHWVCCSCCNAMVYSFTSSERAAQAWNNRRSTGLVHWVEGEKKKYSAICPGGAVSDARFHELGRFRKMIKRLLGQ